MVIIMIALLNIHSCAIHVMEEGGREGAVSDVPMHAEKRVTQEDECQYHRGIGLPSDC